MPGAMVVASFSMLAETSKKMPRRSGRRGRRAGQHAHFLTRVAVRRERANEQLRAQAYELGSGAVVEGQLVARAAVVGDSTRDAVRQPRVGADELVDALLRSPTHVERPVRRCRRKKSPSWIGLVSGPCRRRAASGDQHIGTEGNAHTWSHKLARLFVTT
jgi:hypothetical protein